MRHAFIFDLNGTMIDDMAYHITAWHGIFTRLGANLTRELTKLECYGKNDEVLERVFPGRFTPEEKDQMGFEKEKKYQEEYRPSLRLIDGLAEFFANASREKIKMGIGSAAIMYNIDFVLDGLDIRHYFDAIVSADHVRVSKPDPETFLSCAGLLQTDPSQCIVFEDSPKGVEAARDAGMKTVVLTTMHPESDFSKFDNVLFCAQDYLSPRFASLLQTAAQVLGK